jgi:hypothetical protein
VTAWTVYLETDHGEAGPEECAAVQEQFHEALGAAVGCPRGTLAVRLTVDEDGPVRAVQSAVAQFSLALAKARVATGSRVTYAEQAEGRELPADGRTPGLITPQGLADRFGHKRQWIGQLLLRKGAPEPVPVEGDHARLRVYRTDHAVPYIERYRS